MTREEYMYLYDTFQRFARFDSLPIEATQDLVNSSHGYSNNFFEKSGKIADRNSGSVRSGDSIIAHILNGGYHQYCKV
ncbi:hypothetical protein SKDZ_07G0080 [Saccharomyces kudriavzevii ZP591]|nr:hypothetical protein SKDZ_07G0080 [Saccharomyces kudriavzevii ZP591]